MAKQTFTTGQVLTAAQMTDLQQTAMGGGSPIVKTASYVLVAADAGTVIQMNSASSTTITVNTALFAAGDVVQIQNIGAGTCTITAGTATVTTAGSLALTQWEGGNLYFTSTSASIFFDIVQGAGGSFTSLTSGTFSASASVTLSSISGSYRDLTLRVYDFRPSVDGEQLYIRYNGDSGNNYYVGLTDGGDNTSQAAQSRFRFFGDTDNGAAATGAGELRIINYASSTTKKLMESFSTSSNQTTAANQRMEIKIGLYNSATAISSITILPGSGNITSGSYELLGIN